MVNQPVFNPSFDYASTYGVEEIANRVELILENILIIEPDEEEDPEY
jgi:hypothetical protein